VLPKCAIQLLSNGHERCTCIYIAQLWHEEHVCSKVMTRADMEHKDMCNTTFKMMMRMTGVLEVDILGTTSSQGLVKHLHQQQCDSYTHTHTPLHTFAGFTSKYFPCKMHRHMTCSHACCDDWARTMQHYKSGGLNTT